MVYRRQTCCGLGDGCCCFTFYSVLAHIYKDGGVGVGVRAQKKAMRLAVCVERLGCGAQSDAVVARGQRDRVARWR